jgi:hypothetical protein
VLEVFDDAVKAFIAFIEQQVRECNDALTLLSLIRINQQNIKIMQMRKLPHMESVLDSLNITIWGKFKYVMDLHEKSCNLTAKDFERLDPNPTTFFVTERYSQLSIGLCLLNQGYQDATVYSRYH